MNLSIEEARAISASSTAIPRREDPPKMAEVRNLSFEDLRIVEEIEDWRRAQGDQAGPYHWKHGWIPLDHIAAVKKYGSVKAAADKGFLPPVPVKVKTPRKVKEPKFLQNVRRIENPSHADAMKGANPHYDPFEMETTINCAKVAQAYELRRRGYDVQATIGRAGLPTDDLRRMWRRDSDGQMPRLHQMSSKRGLENRMKAEGSGARFCVAVAWQTFPPGGRPTSAHMFNAEVQSDGSIKYFDAQVGRSDAEEYFKRVDFDHMPVRAYRVDNATPKDFPKKDSGGKATDVGGLIQPNNGPTRRPEPAVRPFGTPSWAAK